MGILLAGTAIACIWLRVMQIVQIRGEREPSDTASGDGLEDAGERFHVVRPWWVQTRVHAGRKVTAVPQVCTFSVLCIKVCLAQTVCLYMLYVRPFRTYRSEHCDC